MPTTRKPEPVSKDIVCSICGLDWERHGEGGYPPKEPTLEKCIELLKADLARARPIQWATSGYPRPLGNITTKNT